MGEIVKPTELIQNLISRKVIQRTRGVSHGPIVRLMSPSDLGERLRPFVFLDRFESDMRQMARSVPVHRHSGPAPSRCSLMAFPTTFINLFKLQKTGGA